MYGYPPPTLTVQSCGFRPDETVHVSGTLTGYDRCGRPFLQVLPAETATASSEGVLRAVLTIPNPTRAIGSYHLRIAASGLEGSRAALDEQPEGAAVALRCQS
jgi:hypothetical protein